MTENQIEYKTELPLNQHEVKIPDDHFVDIFGNYNHKTSLSDRFYNESAIDLSILPSWKEVAQESKAKLIKILGSSIPHLAKSFDNLIQDVAFPEIMAEKIRKIPALSKKLKEITPILLNIALDCNKGINNIIMPSFESNKLKAQCKEAKIKIGFIHKGSNRINPYSNGTETPNRGFTQTVFIDVNDGEHDHSTKNNEHICATTSVCNNIANIKQMAGKRLHLVSHKNADTDSITGLSLYVKALLGEINGNEPSVIGLKNYAEITDLGKWQDIDFATANLAYVIDCIKSRFKNQDWLVYQLAYEVIDRIIINNLDPANLPAEYFMDMKIRVGKKSYLNLGEVINDHEKYHQESVDDFYQNAQFSTLSSGDKFVYIKGGKLNKFAIYQLGIPVIFDGMTVCTTQEWANDYGDILINIRNNLDKAETEVRQQMSLANPSKYNNIDFLRNGVIRPGYNNSNPWFMGETGSQIIQPTGKKRSVLSEEMIFNIVQNGFGL